MRLLSFNLISQTMTLIRFSRVLSVLAHRAMNSSAALDPYFYDTSGEFPIFTIMFPYSYYYSLPYNYLSRRAGLEEKRGFTSIFVVVRYFGKSEQTE